MSDQQPEPPSEASQGDHEKASSPEQGDEWENAGRVIGRFVGRAGSFLGRARDVIKNEYERAQQSEGDSTPQKVWDQAREFVKAGTEKETVARLKELASLAKQNTSELSEEAAGRIARVYTDCTGSPATAAEVKQVAVRFGMMALVTFVTASVLGRAGAAQNLFTQVRDAASEFGAGVEKGNFDDCFESRTEQFYAGSEESEGSAEFIDVDAVVINLD